MSRPIVTTGFIYGGQLHVRNKQRFREQISRRKDGEILLIVEPVTARRSPAQNRLYQAAYVVPLATYLDCDPRWVHGYLKRKFLRGPHLVIQDRQGVVVDEADLEPTTTRLNKIEFSDYLRNIEIWSRDTLGLEVGFAAVQSQGSF